MDRDIVRNDYLGTLPSTLRNRDIHVEFTTAEGEAKAYLIRKYLDADIQRDIWDMLVVRDGELKTKIARFTPKNEPGDLLFISICPLSHHSLSAKYTSQSTGHGYHYFQNCIPNRFLHIIYSLVVYYL